MALDTWTSKSLIYYRTTRYALTFRLFSIKRNARIAYKGSHLRLAFLVQFSRTNKNKD